MPKSQADNLSRSKAGLEVKEKELPSEVEILDLVKLFNYLIAVFRSKIIKKDLKTETDLVILVGNLLRVLGWKKDPITEKR